MSPEADELAATFDEPPSLDGDGGTLGDSESPLDATQPIGRARTLPDIGRPLDTLPYDSMHAAVEKVRALLHADMAHRTDT